MSMSELPIRATGPRPAHAELVQPQTAFLATSAVILSISQALCKCLSTLDQVNSSLKESDYAQIKKSHKVAVNSLHRQAAEHFVGSLVVGIAMGVTFIPKAGVNDPEILQNIGRVVAQTFPHILSAVTKLEEGVQSTAQLDTSLAQNDRLEQRREESRRLDTQRDSLLSNLQKVSDEDAKSFQIVR